MDEASGFVQDSDEMELDQDQCPTSEHLQDQLRDFCAAVVTKLGIVASEKKPVAGGRISSEGEEEEWNWVDALAHLIISVPPAPKRYDDSLERRGSDNFRQMIVSTLKRWADEAEIESAELVRGMFHLLLRQYSGIKEVGGHSGELTGSKGEKILASQLFLCFRPFKHQYLTSMFIFLLNPVLSS